MGSDQPGYGIRPDPGVLPNAAAEPETDPLRFDFPWGANVAYTPRSGYGTPFQILRTIAETSPVIGLCVQCRKDQMASLDWNVAPRDKKATGLDSQIADANEFLNKPNGVTPLRAWIEMAVDDVLIYDALSVYVWPTEKGAAKFTTAKQKNQRYQLLPDEIYGFRLIAGSTIKLEIDSTGEIPQPPNVGFRQIIKGAPLTGGDMTADELLYRPKTLRTETPYGKSPIEMALLIITADLNRLMFNAAYYTEGNIPEAFSGVPDGWSPKTIKQWQEYWDLLMKGDPKTRSRMQFVASTMAKNVHEFKKPDFTTAYDLWLLKMQCACFGLTPSEIGFTDDVNKATSKTQGDVNQRRGVKPMAGHLKGVLDEMLALKGFKALEVVWSGGEGEDALTQAKIIDLNLRNGRISLDEVRAADGNPTIGAGPAMLTPTGPVFWEDAIAASEAAGVDDTAGDQDPDEPPPPASSSAEPPPPGAQDDLKKYRTVATKAVKAGKPVPVFTSAAIPAPTLARLSRALTAAASVDDVTKIFAAVQKARLSPAQQKHQDRMQSKLSSVLAAQGRALATHVASGVEAHG